VPGSGERCDVCGSPMKRYVTGWKCVNVKAHSKAGSRGQRNPVKPGQVRNPRGTNQTKDKIPGSRKAVCSMCENGKRRKKKGCRMCKGRGWVWATR